MEPFQPNYSNLKLCRQKVHVNGKSSDPGGLTVGVQQGSLLGVLLFQLIINDLPTVLKFSSSILYADDTTIYVIGRSVKFMRMKLQKDLDSLQLWLISNNLKLNVSKTKLLLFNKSALSPIVDLFIDGESIENVTCFKFLGIILDSSLSFMQHYTMLYEKLLKSSFVIGYLSKVIPLSCMRQLYYAYFDSHLNYGLVIWFPLLKKPYQNRIYLLQKRIVRHMCGAHFRDHCMPLFKQEKVLVLHDVMKVENCKLMFKLLNRLLLLPVQNLFTIVKQDHNTRNPNVLASNFKSHSANLKLSM